MSILITGNPIFPMKICENCRIHRNRAAKTLIHIFDRQVDIRPSKIITQKGRKKICQNQEEDVRETPIHRHR